MNNPLSLAVEAALTTASLTTTIVDSRRETLETFGALGDDQRVSLAGEAWAFGLRALANACRQAEEARLKDVGQALVGELGQSLRAHAERQQATFVQALEEYFNPRDGKVAMRIDAFVRDGGELARTMGTYLAPEHGQLAKTLATELGASSLLLKRLSPTDSEGVVAVVEAKVGELLAANHQAFRTALDPLAEGGAVGQFLKSLRADLEKADADRAKQLTLATKALDANDETSLLSRLVRETHAAKTVFLQSMNPEETGSPLALLKTALTRMLESHAKAQSEAMAVIDERQRKLDQDVREAVVRLEERRRGDAKAPRGGHAFEAAVRSFIRATVAGAPVTVDDTGGSVGLRPSCKVGDQVLRFTAESAFAGATVVVEAKHDGSCTTTKALAELEIARSNRLAQVGLFVMAKSHATESFPLLERQGSDILVVWDAEDESTDPYLHAAVILALSLASRQRRPDDAGNIKAMAAVEQLIQKELARHEKMRKLADGIKKNAEELGDELRKGNDKMQSLLRDAKNTLKALDIELSVAAEEQGSAPVQLSAATLETARDGLNAA